MRNFAENCGLSSKQALAIRVLLRPFHGTQAQIAEEVGVSERTIHSWLKQPHFQEQLKEMRKQMWQESLDTITGSLNLASEVLQQLLRSESESIKLRSALGIIALGIKAHEEFELEQRISALESALEQRRNGR